MIDWFCWLGILPIKLLFPFNGERALICPVAFVLAVEETERNFLPSTTAVPSAFVLSVFAMVTIIAVGSFFVSVPFAFALVTVSVLSGPSSDTLFTVLFCLGSSACHGFEWDLSLLRDFFCSFFSSSLLLFARSDMQYSCIISNSFVTVFGLRRDMYSPHGPRLIPFTTESMMLWSATLGALARSFMTLWRYSCKVMLPCLRSWKSQDVTSSVLTGRKLEHNSMRSCFQDRMVPGGMFAYQRCAKPFNARTSAFALHAVPPHDASMVASYLRRNSSGSDSPWN